MKQSFDFKKEFLSNLFGMLLVNLFLFPLLLFLYKYLDILGIALSMLITSGILLIWHVTCIRQEIDLAKREIISIIQSNKQNKE